MVWKKTACLAIIAATMAMMSHQGEIFAIEEGNQESSSSSSSVLHTNSSTSDVSNGARRGQSTNVLIAMVTFLESTSPDEMNLLCSLQRAVKRLNPSDPEALYDFLAQYLSSRLNRAMTFILDAFMDENLCPEHTAMINQSPLVEKLRPFWIAEDGLPYSFVNPFWNECIRGKVTTKAQVMANPDIGPRGHLTCGDYYTISEGIAYWRRPGIKNGEQARFQYDSRTKFFTVISQGYYVAYTSTAIAKNQIPVTVVIDVKPGA